MVSEMVATYDATNLSAATLSDRVADFKAAVQALDARSWARYYGLSHSLRIQGGA